MTKLFVPLALAAAALSGTAQAQEASVDVAYGDLDLTSEADVIRLDRRIDAAVDLVCENRAAQTPLWQLVAVRKCAAEAWSDVQNPRQLAIERARGRMPSVEVAQGRSAALPALAIRRR